MSKAARRLEGRYRPSNSQTNLMMKQVDAAVKAAEKDMLFYEAVARLIGPSLRRNRHEQRGK